VTFSNFIEAINMLQV